MADVTLAVVDEESEISYLETSRPAFDGGTTYRPPDGIAGSLIGDRVVVWNTPEGFYDHGFYGQPLEAREAIIDSAVQLSLIEAAALAANGKLVLNDGANATDVDGSTATDAVVDPSASYTAIREQGRAVEGERFDRRLATYRSLREDDVVPKTGYKFGADFRTYNTVESVDDLPHSERLVRVVEADHSFDPRELSLDVRLAGGVRKRMVFALTGANDEIDWLAVSRLTP
jgi:tRNA intron endonuclease